MTLLQRETLMGGNSGELTTKMQLFGRLKFGEHVQPDNLTASQSME